MPAGEIRSLYAVIQFIDQATKPLKQVNQAMDEVKKSVGGLTERINKARESLLLVGGALSAIGYGGFRFWKDATKDLADFQDAMRAFIIRAGENADAILAAMEEAAAGTIDNTQMILNANRAMVMGIDPQYLPKMMKIARAAARAMGTDVKYMFESIAIGTARQSKLILDNLGIIVKADEAYEKYAKTLGKTASQLTEAEKRQAFLMAVMEAGEDIVRKTDLSQESLNEEMQRATVAWKEFKKELAEGALPVIDKIVDGIKSTTQWLKDLPKPVKVVVGTLGVFATAIAGTVGPMMLQAAAFAWLYKEIGGFAGLKAILSGAAASIKGFAASVWGALAPLLPWIAVIGAVVAAILLLQDVLVKGWEKSYLGQFVAWLIEKLPFLKPVAEGVSEAVNWMREGFEWATSSIQGLISWIQQGIDALGPFKYALFGPVGAILFLKDNLNTVISVIKEFVSWIQEASKVITENPLFMAAQTALSFTPVGMGLSTAKIITGTPIPTISSAAISNVSTVSRVEHKVINVPRIEIHVKEGDKYTIKKAVREVFTEDLLAYGV